MKLCKKGLHEYPEGVRRCPECKRASQQTPKYKAYQVAYYAAHREEMRAYSVANKEKIAAYRAVRRALFKLLSGGKSVSGYNDARRRAGAALVAGMQGGRENSGGGSS